MCKKRIKLMKIIPKIALYAAIIIFLSISLDERAGSQTEPPKPNASLSKARMKTEAIPYDVNSKVKIKNPIYTKKITLNLNLELGH